jgi:hypothetical protein
MRSAWRDLTSVCACVRVCVCVFLPVVIEGFKAGGRGVG